MSLDENNDIITSFNVICPECGVGNPENAKFCLFCEKNLEEVILFLEDDSFDIELTKEAILEYRKKFWGSERSGKINKYYLDKIENIEYGRPVSRLIFNYQDKRIVIPLKKENLEELKLELNKLV